MIGLLARLAPADGAAELVLGLGVSGLTLNGSGAGFVMLLAPGLTLGAADPRLHRRVRCCRLESDRPDDVRSHGRRDDEGLCIVH